MTPSGGRTPSTATSVGTSLRPDESLDSATARAAWVTGAVQRSGLPDAGWPSLEREIRAELLPNLSCDGPLEAAVAARLVGPPSGPAPANPLLLEPPFMLPEVRRALEAKLAAQIGAQLRQAQLRIEQRQSAARARFERSVHQVFGAAAGRRAEALGGADPAEVMGQGLAELLEGRQAADRLKQLAGCRLPGSIRRFIWRGELLEPGRLAKVSAVLAEQLKLQSIKAREAGEQLETGSSNLLARMCRNMLEAPQLAGLLQPDTGQRLVACMGLHQLARPASDQLAQHVLLLLPLLHTLPEAPIEELVAMLHGLIDRVMPTAGQARAISSQLLAELEQTDPAMHSRIGLLVQALPNDLDLPHVDTVGDYRAIVEARSPLALIDLWLSSGFVGMIETERCLFGWDQSILTGPGIWTELGRALLPLLRQEVMGALDSGDLYRIFSDTREALPWQTLLALKSQSEKGP